VIEICLLAFGAVLLLGSVGAFFLYIPFLPIAVVVVIGLGMALTFLIGVWVGSTRVVRLRVTKKSIRRSKVRRTVAAMRFALKPSAIAAPLPSGSVDRPSSAA
jgi:hypothetical protein